MSSRVHDSRHGDLPRKVDEALRHFWQGSASEFDDLVREPGDQSQPGPCSLLAALLTNTSPPPAPPIQLGDYSIVRTLGTGGMSIVYEARQHRTGQAVALKVMRRWGAGGEDHLRRFQREVRTLALLKHPHIAALYDAGQTSEGHHYFAMELVVGRTLEREIQESKPLAEYRTGEGRQRLSLFRDICRAIHHAHQRGVVHRDLKPGNIIIDAAGAPKVLDFGLARLLESDAGAASGVSETGRILGTLAYMSPEQAQGRTEEIDIRSDVYSLGVILYEWLVGRRPYEAHSTAVAAAVRTISEVDPPRPGSVHRALRGELEAIILRALEKDAARRYQSAAELADDLQRYLEHQPISARAPSALYQIQKLVVRHKIPAALSAALFVVAIAAAAVFGLQRRQLAVERDAARQQSERAKRVSDYLGNVLSLVDHGGARKELRVRDVLDRAARGVDQQLRDQPDTAASIHETLAKSYLAMRSYKEARFHAERSLELRRHLYGDLHPLYADSLDLTGRVAVMDRSRNQAQAILTQALELRRALPDRGGADVADSMINLGQLGEVYGDYTEAERWYRQSIEVRRAALGDGPQVAEGMHKLATMLVDMGRYEEGEALLKETLALRERLLGPDHPEIGMTLTDLGEIYWNQGRYAEGEALHRRQIRILGAVGRDSYDLASALTDLANVLVEQGGLEEPEKLYREGMEMLRRVTGEASADRALNLNDYGRFLAKQGRYAEAEPLARQVYALWGEGTGSHSAATAYASRNLAVVCLGRGQFEESDRLSADAIRIFEKIMADRNPAIIAAYAGRAELYQVLGRSAEAEKLAREALRVAELRLAPGDRRIGERMLELAVIVQPRAPEEAAELGRQGFELVRKAIGERHPDYVWALATRGSLLLASGEDLQAESLLRQAVDLERSLPRTKNPDLATALNQWGELLLRTDRAAEAEPRLREAVDILEFRLSVEDPRLAAAQLGLGRCLAKLGRFSEATPLISSAGKTFGKQCGPRDARTQAAARELTALRAAGHDSRTRRGP